VVNRDDTNVTETSDDCSISEISTLESGVAACQAVPFWGISILSKNVLANGSRILATRRQISYLYLIED